MIQQATQKSLEENKALQVKMQKAQALVYQRLLAKGMSHIPTDPNGDCFFESLIATLGLAKTPGMLRREICDYLSAHAAWFEDSFAGGREAFIEHVRRMRQPGTWATAYEVTAASHVLLAPIHLITDHANEAGSVTIVEPPACRGGEIHQRHRPPGYTTGSTQSHLLSLFIFL